MNNKYETVIIPEDGMTHYKDLSGKSRILICQEDGMIKYQYTDDDLEGYGEIDDIENTFTTEEGVTYDLGDFEPITYED